MCVGSVSLVTPGYQAPNRGHAKMQGSAELPRVGLAHAGGFEPKRKASRYGITLRQWPLTCCSICVHNSYR
jgi:hypothetical protein